MKKTLSLNLLHGAGYHTSCSCDNCTDCQCNGNTLNQISDVGAPIEMPDGEFSRQIVDIPLPIDMPGVEPPPPRVTDPFEDLDLYPIDPGGGIPEPIEDLPGEPTDEPPPVLKAIGIGQALLMTAALTGGFQLLWSMRGKKIKRMYG